MSFECINFIFPQTNSNKYLFIRTNTQLLKYSNIHCYLQFLIQLNIQIFIYIYEYLFN